MSNGPGVAQQDTPNNGKHSSMPTRAASTVIQLADPGSARSERLRSKLAAQQGHLMRIVLEIRNRLEAMNQQLPEGLLHRAVSAYEDIYQDLAAIDPDRPPNAQELRDIGTRLQLLQAGVAQLLAMAGLPRSVSTNRQQTDGR